MQRLASKALPSKKTLFVGVNPEFTDWEFALLWRTVWAAVEAGNSTWAATQGWTKASLRRGAIRRMPVLASRLDGIQKYLKRNGIVAERSREAAEEKMDALILA